MGSPTTVLAKITRSYPVRLPWWPCRNFFGQGGLPFWAFSFLPFFGKKWKHALPFIQMSSQQLVFSDLTHEKEKLKPPYKYNITFFLLNARMLQCVWKNQVVGHHSFFSGKFGFNYQAWSSWSFVKWRDETKPTGPLDLSHQILDDDELMKHLRGVANSQAKLKLLCTRLIWFIPRVWASPPRTLCPVT